MYLELFHMKVVVLTVLVILLAIINFSIKKD